MKKEENLELLKKLAIAKVDTSLMRSSKNLGVKKDSRRIALARALQNQKAALTRESDDSALQSTLLDSECSSDSEGSSRSSDRLTVEHEANSNPVSPVLEVGKGLKRPLDVDTSGNPVLNKRQRTKKRTTQPPADDASSWDGFYSSSEDELTSVSGLGSTGNSDSESDADSDSGSDKSPETTASMFPFANKSITHVPSRPVPRANSSFKTWATKQINEARDFTPTTAIPSAGLASEKSVPRLASLRPAEEDPLPPELVVRSDVPQRQAYSVLVKRSAEVQTARLKLPIVAEEQKIMEAIHNNPVIIVRGATGSGKTTQVGFWTQPPVIYSNQ